MDPGRITVRGTGAVHARPDRLLLAFTVTSVSRSIEDALADVAARSHRLNAGLDGLGVAADARATTGVKVGQEIVWDEGRQVDRGYRASYALHVHLDSSASVGELVRQAVEDAAAHVTGPWWTLSPAHPARLEACRQAAEDARRRAEAFASTLGARLGPVVAAAEPAAKPGAHDLGYLPLAQRVAGGQGSEIDVQPGEMEVNASVDVSFALDL